jgi:hypothetical protein
MFQYIQRNRENNAFRDSTYHGNEKYAETAQNKRPVRNASAFTVLSHNKNKHAKAEQKHRNFIFIKHDFSPL